MRLALHACCGPCLLEPYDAFASETDAVTVVYWNPNIHPVEEYERRRETIARYAEAARIELIELAYDPAAWLEKVGPLAGSPEARCRACYELRIGGVARWAAENGYDAVATTLTVSPYQDADVIAETGERVARQAGVTYLTRDFRDRYAEATRRSRELEMYRQNHCGCVMSDVEARAQRAARKAERAARKASARDRTAEGTGGSDKPSG